MDRYSYSQLVNLSPPKRFNRKVFKKFLFESQFDVLNRERLNKPGGGLWSSTYTPLQDYDSQWIQWCAENCQPDWIGQDNILLEISNSARIFRISNAQDLKNLYTLYPRDERLWTPPTVHWSHSHGVTVWLDYQKIAEDYDIIWLTEDGQHYTRSPEYFGSNPIKKIDLYGWDCESSLMLNNVINRFKKITTRRR